MADPDPQLSPEKRLLQLIEGSGKSAGGEKPAGAAPSMSGAKGRAAAMNIESFKQKTQQYKEKALSAWKSFQNGFGLHEANKLARVVLILLIAFAVINAAYEMRISQKDPLSGLDVPQRKITDISIDEPTIGSSFLQNSDARNIFLPFSKREEVKAESQKNSSSSQLVEMTKNLKLTGISYNPEDPKKAYCMIEDLQKSLTTFLRIGDQISGMKVAKINEESVELQHDDEKIEIR